MRIPTEKLNRLALNWAVATCQGITQKKDFSWYHDRRDSFNYSTNWAQAGPIIERETITLDYWGGKWHASVTYGRGDPYQYADKSPLVAAMRVWVATQLGDEVEIPDELLEGETT